MVYPPNGPAGTITATINGIEHMFPAGLSVLDAAMSVGIEIPTLCSDNRIEPAGVCRMCLVVIKGRPGEVVSCMTPLDQGMEIETATPDLNGARRMDLRMLAQNYPPGPFKAFPEKPFHRLASIYGLTEADFTDGSDPALVDDSHPYIRVDMSQCIECYRCVRICEQVPGRFVWQIMDRGESTHIVPDGPTLLESSCISCGACVETCPTGALEDRSILKSAAATNWTKTTCPYCGVGCEMNVGTREGNDIVQILPSASSPVNHGHLCVKGRYAHAFVRAGDRVTEPMIRRVDGWEAVSWEEAIGYAADHLTGLINKYGPDSIGILGSARATNEENYLVQKFARICLGTNNVDCCARVCHTPSAAGLKMMLGTGAATNSFADIELASTIMILGANTTESHPIVGERILQSVLRNKTKLIVIDPRRTEIAEHADVHLQLRPGTNIPLLNAIASVIVEENLIDSVFLAERINELDEFREFVAAFSPENVADVCGVEAESIRQAARLYAGAKPSMCFHGLGLTEHVQGTEGVMCLINLALLTGNIGKRGTGVNPLRGQNNVQGAAQMGCDPGILTGSIALDEGRGEFEKVWKAPVPTRKGLDLMEMIDTARSGGLKALWSIGYDIFLTNPKAADTGEALRSLEFVVVQDMFMNETAREFGHLFLPASSSFEKDGTFMNAERRVQRIRKAIEPRGNSRPDWRIICDVARAMGKGEFFDYNNPEDIWNEVRTVWKGAAGISYERIAEHGLQWPCTSDDAPAIEVLHVNEFAHDKKAALRRIKYRPSPETVDDAYPFLLNTGRSRYAFNSGTMTARTSNITLRPTDLLSINPADRKELLLSNGERVRITSRYGEAELAVADDPSIRPGEAFATFHDPRVFLNRLTGPHRDRFVHSPEYKLTAVKIERV